MFRSLDDLRGIHRGADIYVIGSAASVGFIDPEFFEDRITIGVNDVYRRIPTTYTVRKGSLNAQAAADSGIPLILAEFDCGNHACPQNNIEGAIYFSHADNGGGHDVDLSVIGSGKLLVSLSTLGTAMHLACEMGAGAVYLVGVDGGTINGELHYPGYDLQPTDRSFYKRFIPEHLEQARRIRDALQAHYGCRIVSLSPFVGLTTDGNRWESAETPPACRHCRSADTVYRCLAGHARFFECARCGCMTSDLEYRDVSAIYQNAGYIGHQQVSMDALRLHCSNNVDWLDADLPERSALDVGCNEGAMMQRLESDGWDVRGWDVNPLLAGDRVTIGTEFSAVEIGRRFGAVISRETIEHVPDHRGHLRELAAAVLPGGVLQIQTPRPHPNYADPIAYQHSHLILIDPAAMRGMLIDVGLTIERHHLWENGQLWQARKPHSGAVTP